MDTKSMRQKILDLAIRGKLVPQDPTDEPASVLLKRIRAEKQQMVKDGKLKAKDIKGDTVIFKGEDNLHYEKVGSEVRCIETEIPFEVPKNWVWTRIGSLFNLQSGKFISASEIHDVPDSIFRYACYGGNGIRGYADHYNREGSFPLIGRQGALCGNINHADGRFYATEHAIVVEHFCEINIEWMCYFLSQLNLNQYSTATAQPGLSVTTINSIPIPLPPHKEQLSISDAISHAFTQIDIVEQGKLDLQSIIAQTKSKILDLAIRGKLVPQEPADEPASLLLERIRAEKEQLIKEGKIKRDKNESYIFRGVDKSYYQDKGGKRLCVEEMIPFDLPQQWLWCQLGEICDYGNCNNTDTATLPDDAWILDLEDIEKDTGKVLQRITVAKRKSNSTKHAF